jgi:N-acetyl-1-D-myo-inositol-2-amino-2-deoxy-alpha-D-glucopyranoside deacetylase
MLPWLDPVRLEEDIRSVIEEVKPDVVVTFDEDGLYGHPDHIAVHERTTAAVAALGVGAPLLRYVSMPPGAMRQLTQAVASGSVASARSPAPAPAIFGNLDPDAFGAMAPPPTLVMELAAWAPRKLQALRCHRTQLEGSVLDQIDVEEAVRFLGIEHYRHAGAGAPGPAFVDHLPGTSDPTASR